MRTLLVVCFSILCVVLFGTSASAQSEIDSPKPFDDNFAFDAVTDTVVISVGLGLGLGQEVLIRTGEPQLELPVDRSTINGFDRRFVGSDAGSAEWALGSHIGVGLAGAVALIDAGLGLAGEETSWAPFILYLETASLTYAAGNIGKLGAKRPRPRVYRAGYSNVRADDTASFYSLHTSFTASLSATATYLAFVRDPEGGTGWATAVGGALLTTGVGLGRIYSGAHFPSDVMVGGLVGVGIGVMVPHLHRLALRVSFDGEQAYLGGHF